MPASPSPVSSPPSRQSSRRSLSLAIVLHLLNANPSNGIVDAIHQAGSWLSSPFHNLFSPKDGDLRMALNWGLAALVYLVIARVIARVVMR